MKNNPTWNDPHGLGESTWRRHQGMRASGGHDLRGGLNPMGHGTKLTSDIHRRWGIGTGLYSGLQQLRFPLVSSVRPRYDFQGHSPITRPKGTIQRKEMSALIPEAPQPSSPSSPSRPALPTSSTAPTLPNAARFSISQPAAPHALGLVHRKSRFSPTGVQRQLHAHQFRGSAPRPSATNTRARPTLQPTGSLLDRPVTGSQYFPPSIQFKQRALSVDRQWTQRHNGAGFTVSNGDVSPHTLSREHQPSSIPLKMSQSPAIHRKIAPVASDSSPVAGSSDRSPAVLHGVTAGLSTHQENATIASAVGRHNASTIIHRKTWNDFQANSSVPRQFETNQPTRLKKTLSLRRSDSAFNATDRHTISSIAPLLTATPLAPKTSSPVQRNREIQTSAIKTPLQSTDVNPMENRPIQRGEGSRSTSHKTSRVLHESAMTTSTPKGIATMAPAVVRDNIPHQISRKPNDAFQAKGRAPRQFAASQPNLFKRSLSLGRRDSAMRSSDRHAVLTAMPLQTATPMGSKATSPIQRNREIQNSVINRPVQSTEAQPIGGLPAQGDVRSKSMGCKPDRASGGSAKTPSPPIRGYTMAPAVVTHNILHPLSKKSKDDFQSEGRAPRQVGIRQPLRSKKTQSIQRSDSTLNPRNSERAMRRADRNLSPCRIFNCKPPQAARPGFHPAKIETADRIATQNMMPLPTATDVAPKASSLIQRSRKKQSSIIERPVEFTDAPPSGDLPAQGLGGVSSHSTGRETIMALHASAKTPPMAKGISTAAPTVVRDNFPLRLSRKLRDEFQANGMEPRKVETHHPLYAEGEVNTFRSGGAHPPVVSGSGGSLISGFEFAPGIKANKHAGISAATLPEPPPLHQPMAQCAHRSGTEHITVQHVMRSRDQRHGPIPAPHGKNESANGPAPRLGPETSLPLPSSATFSFAGAVLQKSRRFHHDRAGTFGDGQKNRLHPEDGATGPMVAPMIQMLSKKWVQPATSSSSDSLPDNGFLAFDGRHISYEGGPLLKLNPPQPRSLRPGRMPIQRLTAERQQRRPDHHQTVGSAAPPLSERMLNAIGTGADTGSSISPAPRVLPLVGPPPTSAQRSSYSGAEAFQVNGANSPAPPATFFRSADGAAPSSPLDEAVTDPAAAANADEGAGQIDMDEFVEKAWQKIMFKLAIERERQGLTQWI